MSTENTIISDDKPPVSDDPKVINQADHERAVKDMLKYKGQVSDLTSRMESLVNQVEEMKANKLKDKEDYKSLYEQEVANHNETKQRLTGVSKNVVFAEKHRAVFPALKKAGFVDDAEKLLTSAALDSLEFETTSDGRFLIEGVDTFVDNFKREYSFAFKDAQPPRFNAGVGNTSHTVDKITPAMINDLEDKVKAGKATQAEYHELIKKYNEQQQRG